MRLCAESVNSSLAIEREGAGADERREISGGPPPREVHLEKAILRVKKTKRASDILARGAAN
jgi:hypothetical protein